MRLRIVLLAALVLGISLVSTSQDGSGGKPDPKQPKQQPVNPSASQAATDIAMSDHDRIEKLQLQVADLQDKLVALSQRYEKHTHRLRVGTVPMARIVDCDVASASVSKICHQLGDDSVSVMFAPNTDALVSAVPDNN